MRNTRQRARAVSIASALFVLSLGLTPAVNAADHLDSPAVSAQGSIDITDLYTFSASGGNATVFILNVNPGAGALPNSGTTFGPGVDYKIKVDTNADLTPDITYLFRFGTPNGMGVQSLKLWRNGVLISNGWTGQDNLLPGGGRTTAGLYDDPFFFDLAAFQGQVLGSGNGRTFCNSQVNFFNGLNVSAMILRVPNSSLGGNGMNIGVWATTEAKRGGKMVQLDQMGRPAINTVFNNQTHQKFDRDAFNRAQPSEQVALGFQSHAQDVLTALGAANPAGDAALLFPDVLTYQTGNMAGFLNGRRLTDDVIDTELGLVTNGGIPGDCISNDSAFPGAWPYLAPAN